jgi:hypothetical protein
MTWRLLVGGARTGQAIDVDDWSSRRGVWLPNPPRPASYFGPPEELYLPRLWSLRVAHPCVPGMDLYREWWVLVRAPWSMWQPQPQLIEVMMRACTDVSPDLEVLEPTGMHAPFPASWWAPRDIPGRFATLLAEAVAARPGRGTVITAGSVH